jgi:hypothetical protein
MIETRRWDVLEFGNEWAQEGLVNGLLDGYDGLLL